MNFSDLGLVANQQGSCGNTVGGACSGLSELTNQGILGFLGGAGPKETETECSDRGGIKLLQLWTICE